MIEVCGLSKKFDGVEALRDLTMKIQKGSVYGLLGSNGAGKTTLLKTVCGIYREDQGSITVEGQRVYENEELKQRMVYVSDALYFFPGYTVSETARFYRSLYRNWSEERFAELESFFGIDRTAKIHKMSKGMQRQVALWLSLAAMPEIMVLDEPLDGLDTVMRQKVKNLLVQDVAGRELTVLISSHNLREMEDFCDHVSILHQGRLLIEKDVDELKRDIHKIQIAFREEPAQDLFESLQLLHWEKRGSVSMLIIRGKGKELQQYFSQFNPVIMDVLPLTLEEIFIYEMGDHAYEVDRIIFA